MNDELPTRDGPLPPELAQRVDAACDRFEAAWRAGQRPRIEDYLGEAEQDIRPVLAGELILLEMAYRRQLGENPQPEEYRARFPGAIIDPEKPAAADYVTRDIEQRAALIDCGRLSALPMIGEEFGGCRILALLGEGGMGIVYRAKESVLRREVALKVMKPEVAAQLQARERFLREARAMAALQNDHVVQVHQVGEVHGIPFLTMPLLLGETLADRLKRDGALPVADILRIGREAAAGLAAAHARRLIHRDVKPANIWLETTGDEPAVSGRPGRVKLLDFGLARDQRGLDPVTLERVRVGTLGYMSPEQIEGAELDARSDLFSLGVVFYRMTTGVAPFQGATMTAVFRSTLHDTPPAPVQLRPEVPRELSELIARLLAKDPQVRPASAREVAEVLQRLQAGVTADKPLPPPPAAVPHRPRWFLPVGALGAAATILLAVAFIVWLRNRPAAELAEVPLQLQLSLQAKKKDNDALVSIGEPSVLPLQAGDALRVEARTATPAYFYVLNMDAEGKVWPMYPWRGNDWDDLPEEKPRDFFCIPDPAKGDAAKLQAGPSGIESVVVLARAKPLTAAERQQLRDMLGAWPKEQGTFDPLRAAVTIGGDQVTFADARDRDVRGAINPGDGVELKDPVLRMRRLLQGDVRALNVSSRGVCYTFKGE